MSAVVPGGALWPADVIHVNEDGWVLINRGSRHGVSVGLHLLVVGTGVRDLNDLFAPGIENAPEPPPPALRIRRTYELLEVVYAEESCAIAIATRTPAARRPTVYRGPEGELLVWVPLPEGYSWPPPNSANDEQAQPETSSWSSDSAEAPKDEASDLSDETDTPPERAPQDDEPWEEALPLNSVSVGDIVLPAIAAGHAAPPTSASTSAKATSASATAAPHEPALPFESGRTYDWMKKPGE